MTNPTQPGGRRGIHTAAAATVVLLLIGVALIAVGMRTSGGPPQPVSDAAASDSAAPLPSPSRNPRQSQSSRTSNARKVLNPRRVSPAVDLTRRSTSARSFPPPHRSLSTFRTLASTAPTSWTLVWQPTAPSRSLRTPSAPGWFYPGPSPGQFGPAVIAGHVDSDRGPAVFYRLGELDPGDRVHVTRADGTVGTFLIDRVEAFAKAEFPTHEVYGDTTNRAELRLITCGGNYDDDAGYLGNVVAFAHLVSAR